VTGWQAFWLGAIQGLGEFLPISSSAHLIVVPWLLSWPDQGLAFDVALHLGTLVAVLFVFAGDWFRLLRSFLRGLRRGKPFGEPEGRLLGLLALATIPGGVAGLLLEHWADTTLRSPGIIAGTMGSFGIVLLLADRHGGGSLTSSSFTVRDAMLIGAAQALAVIPGVSRSGSTISAALFLGYRRDEAARISFLLATPLILGAAGKKAPHLLHSSGSSEVLLGMAAAAAFGLLSIRALLGHVKTGSYRPFVYYRWAFALSVALVLLVRGFHLG